MKQSLVAEHALRREWTVRLRVLALPPSYISVDTIMPSYVLVIDQCDSITPDEADAIGRAVQLANLENCAGSLMFRDGVDLREWTPEVSYGAPRLRQGAPNDPVDADRETDGW